VQQEISVLQKQTYKDGGNKNRSCGMQSVSEYFHGLKHGHFQELEKGVVEFVRLKRITGVPITCETIKYKA
jgi:hypothetical protein